MALRDETIEGKATACFICIRKYVGKAVARSGLLFEVVLHTFQGDFDKTY